VTVSIARRRKAQGLEHIFSRLIGKSRRRLLAGDFSYPESRSEERLVVRMVFETQLPRAGANTFG
jgi:hypothetical protein